VNSTNFALQHISKKGCSASKLLRIFNKNIISFDIVSWKHAFNRIFCIRDDHYPVYRLDIRQDSELATGYGYPKTAFRREPDTDPDIRNTFVDILRIQTFGKSCTLRNHSFILVSSEPFCLLCHDFKSVYGVILFPLC